MVHLLLWRVRFWKVLSEDKVKTTQLATTFGVGLAMGMIIHAHAMPELDSMTICYEVGKDDTLTSKHPCMVTNTGGGGSLVTIYQYEGKEYTIVSEQSGDYLNDEPYHEYTRGQFFERLDPAKLDYSYYCYESNSVHFCSKQ